MRAARTGTGGNLEASPVVPATESGQTMKPTSRCFGSRTRESDSQAALQIVIVTQTG